MKQIATSHKLYIVASLFLALNLLFFTRQNLAAGQSGNTLFASSGGGGSACSQANPCSLQTAVSQAEDGDTVYVAAGTYTGNDPDFHVIGVNASINLLGGWDGAPDGAATRNPALHISIIDGETERRGITLGKAAVIDGFTIQNGAGVAFGAGILVDTGATGTAVLSGNIFNDNIALWYGGGVSVGASATAVIENNQFFGNQSGDGSMSAYSGGGIFAQAFSVVTVAANRFQNNQSSSGAAIAADRSHITIERNHFVDNQSPTAVDLSASGAYTALLTNNLFQNNAGYALTVHGDGYADVQILHNTFAGNGVAGVHTHALEVAYEAGATIANNIIASHAGPSIFTHNDGAVSGSHNLFWQNGSDPHPLVAPVYGDPRFVAPHRGDFRLGLRSWAVNRGADVGIAVDFEGHPRPMGGGFDIGFDEQTRRLIPAPGVFTFEDAGVQATINQVGDLDSVSVVLVEDDHPDADGAIGLGRYWMIAGLTEDDEDAAGFNLDLTLPRNGAADPYICRYDGQLWDCARDESDDDTVTRKNITAFSDWAVVDGYTPEETLSYLYLVKDIELYQATWTPAPAFTAVMDNIMYFSGDDGVHGFELWRTNGAESGTSLVKDINPGLEGSTPFELIVINDILYFTADDGVHGYELWRSDGTAAGTTLVKDIRPGAEGSGMFDLVAFNDLLFFVADDGTHGYELWRSDGTAAGTVMVKDIYPGSDHSYAYPLGMASGGLLLVANTPEYGDELWRTDGTENGTYLLQDINPGVNGSNLTYGDTLNNVFYFGANDGSGSGLWRSDGTVSGTYLLSPPDNTGAPNEFTTMGSNLFFNAFGDGYGMELWKTNGSLAGTTMVKDINPGASGSAPSSLTAVGNILFFTANNGDDGSELWQSDGTADGTFMVKDIYPGGGNDSYPAALMAAHNRLYFTAYNDVYGRELWQSDGSEAGTVRLTDINPGAGGSDPHNLTAMGDLLLFGAESDSGKGLYAVSDPQTGPTFTVTNKEDSDGVCTVGHCSLREAIQAANDQPGQNSIVFASSVTGWIQPASTLPTITEDLHINGPGPSYIILNGALFNNGPIMRVNSGHLMIHGLTFYQGGGALNPAGGGLLAQSQLTLNNVHFSHNQAHIGGGLITYQNATLNNVQFYDNQASNTDGGAMAAHNGTVTITNSRFTNNTAADRGGAIFAATNFLNIYTSEFGNNLASGSGGGAIYTTAQPTISQTSFQGNHVEGYGGALALTGSMPANLTNLLLVENTAADDGQAIYLTGLGPALTHNLIHTTIAGPERQAGTAVYTSAAGTLNIANSIIANHDTGLERTDGTVNENYNLFYDNETDRTGVSAGANSFNANPLFVNPAGDYRIKPGSPAAGAGTSASVTQDYFNTPRPQGAGFDIGYHELIQHTITAPGEYGFANSGVTMTVQQMGNLAAIQLIWIDADHPNAGDETGAGGYWMIEGLDSGGQPATGFNLTLTLPHDNHPDPAVCRWTGSEWDCGRDGYNASHVWRHNVTAFSDWAVGESGEHTLYLPLVVRP
jgi:CSLREA domain-containing protein